MGIVCRIQFDLCRRSLQEIRREKERAMAGKAIARSFFDQYSVVCVFGSVMGCVIVPLLAQVGLSGATPSAAAGLGG